LRRAASVEDIRLIARRTVPRAVFDYTDGGSERELSMERSRELFRCVEFKPRVLRDVSTIDTTVTILGRKSPLPLVLAPTGYTRIMHHTGESAVARAAGRAGVPYCLSTMGTTSIERLAETAQETRRWFQLYIWRDRDISMDFVERAGKSGYDTLVLTVDVPVAARRLRDIRNGLTIPPSLTLRTLLGAARRPGWWLNLLTTEPLEFACLSSWKGTVAELTNSMFDPSVTLDEFRVMRDQWNGSLVVKGVLGVDDALALVEAGADGVVVSNHGGRQLDAAATPLLQLPAIVAAVGDRAQVFVDGSVMSGSDMVAAVTMGADAVMVGRAYLYGLMAGGERGVDRVLEILSQQFSTTMRLLGVDTVAGLKTLGSAVCDVSSTLGVRPPVRDERRMRGGLP